MPGSSWGTGSRDPVSWRAGRTGCCRTGGLSVELARLAPFQELGSTQGLDLGTHLGRCGFRGTCSDAQFRIHTAVRDWV